METERRKLDILVAIDGLPDPCWKNLLLPAEVKFVREGTEAFRELTRCHYDVVFLDLYLAGRDSLDLLRRCHTEKLCDSIVLTSEVPSFSYAQQGILYGVSAYLLRPLKREEVEEVLWKILAATDTRDSRFQEAARRVLSHLREGDGAERFLQEGRSAIPEGGDPVERAFSWSRFYGTLIDMTFRAFPWLGFFHHPEEFRELDFVQDADSEMVIHYCRRKVEYMGQVLIDLYPQTSEKLDEVLRYLLENADRNLQQREVAGRFYVTTSTLSTRFQRCLGISWREYMMRVKIARGQYLLRKGEVAPEDLAAHLGYREYFSKLFHRTTGRTIQEYAREEEWSGYII